MRQLKIEACTAALALVLGGCATPGVTVDRQGSLPSPSAAGGGVELVAGDAEHAPAGLASALEGRIKALGWARGDGAPAFRLESAYSERGGKVGAFAQAAGYATEPNWLTRPVKVHWWSWRGAPQMRQLGVRIVDASGKQVYAARAVEQLRGPKDAGWDRLVDAALAPAAAP